MLKLPPELADVSDVLFFGLYDLEHLSLLAFVRAAFATGFGLEIDIRDGHPFFDRFAHIVDRKGSHTNRG